MTDRDHETITSPYLRSLMDAQPESKHPDGRELADQPFSASETYLWVLCALCGAVAVGSFLITRWLL